MTRGRILIIDDEEIIIEGFRMKLEAAGYEVVTVLSGKEGIEIAENEIFDIVYVDLVIPDMRGVEICKRIKKISPKTAVILISDLPANIMDELQDSFFEAGGRKKILTKPLFGDELVEETESILKEIKKKFP